MKIFFDFLYDNVWNYQNDNEIQKYLTSSWRKNYNYKKNKAKISCFVFLLLIFLHEKNIYATLELVIDFEFTKYAIIKDQTIFFTK